ncbi:ribosome maturation factor [Desulfovibrio sp. OttesenSCG-928-O18]|nr:ribosome maturation factor [Desulfovibrio sp. OttesenSCG-928-O18]
MSETDIAKTITELAAPLAASLGLEIWGVDVAFGKRGIVRVFVEGENGVNIDACAELSRLLGLGLDVDDVIPGAYVLEVSSPGLERTFFTAAQLAAQTSKVVEVALHAPGSAYPDRKKLLGTLTDAKDGEFTLVPLDAPEENPVPAVFAWDDIKKAKLVHFLPEPQGLVKGRKPKQAKKPAAARESAREKAGDEPGA